MAGFFQSIAIMLQGGMPLTKAIMIAKEAIENTAIKEQITLVADHIMPRFSCASLGNS